MASLLPISGLHKRAVPPLPLALFFLSGGVGDQCVSQPFRLASLFAHLYPPVGCVVSCNAITLQVHSRAASRTLSSRARFKAVTFTVKIRKFVVLFSLGQKSDIWSGAVTWSGVGGAVALSHT